MRNAAWWAALSTRLRRFDDEFERFLSSAHRNQRVGVSERGEFIQWKLFAEAINLAKSRNNSQIYKYDYLARPDDFVRPRRVEESLAPLVDVVMLQEFVQLGSMSNSLLLALDSCLVESVCEFLKTITYVREMLALENEMFNSSWKINKTWCET